MRLRQPPQGQPQSKATTLYEVLARNKPLTNRLPDEILRAQTSAEHPQATDVLHCGSNPGLWYCVQTGAKGELRALTDISKAGFRPYCPMFVHQRRRLLADGRKPFLDVIEPLFPRYLFVLLDLASEQWRRITGCDGVERLMLSAGERPMPLPTSAIQELQKLGRPGDGVIDQRTPAEKNRSESLARREAAKQALDVTYFPHIEPEQRVRVTSGPLTGLEGICRLSAPQRLTVLFTMFGRETEAVLTSGEIEAV